MARREHAGIAPGGHPLSGVLDPLAPSGLAVCDGRGRVLYTGLAFADGLDENLTEKLGEVLTAVERGSGPAVEPGWTVVPLQGPGPAKWLVLVRELSRPVRRALDHLSPRQRQVARLAAGGSTVPEIAEKLGISAHTAKGHLKVAYKRLNVSSRVDLVMVLQGLDRR
jgi:DNA-binding CsgD family transcriptional regulator